MRGVCRECAVPLRLGLACRGRCEADVSALGATLEQSMRTAALSSGMLQQTPRLFLGLAAISLAVGVLVLALAALLPRFRAVGLLGLPFLAIGALVLVVVRRMRAPAVEAPRR
jgi:hypothetical protein